MATEAIRWQQDGLSIIDQTLLPDALIYIELNSLEAVWEAIKQLRVRGAPAIGICAAYGVVVGLDEQQPQSLDEAAAAATAAATYLATSRPTAVNLFWALSRMEQRIATASEQAGDVKAFRAALLEEAQTIYADEMASCRAIGEAGLPLIAEGAGVLTHCNAGGLATGELGTALAPMYLANEQGLHFKVYADETRPLLQGARLTAWELQQGGVDVTVICDNMAAQVMREGKVNLVITGADRIAANGDAANKIGTYGVALLAKAHGIPFYIAAPASTFDFSLPDGDSIPIEQRDPVEVTCGFGKRTAPDAIQVYNPAFDVTPVELIAGFITDKGLLRPPYADSFQVLQFT